MAAESQEGKRAPSKSRMPPSTELKINADLAGGAASMGGEILKDSLVCVGQLWKMHPQSPSTLK